MDKKFERNIPNMTEAKHNAPMILSNKVHGVKQSHRHEAKKWK